MEEMDQSKFNDGGKFRTAAGTDDLPGIDGAIVSLPQDTEGLSDYEDGDECDITIKGRVGAADEEGNRPITPINIDLKPMPSSAKMYRRDQGNSMPPASTLGGDEEA